MSKKNKKVARFGFGQARSIKEYSRHHGQKPPGKVIVLVCEGEETEPNYFGSLRQKFRLSTLEIKVISGKGAPINVVDCAIDEKRKLDDRDDEVWCVLDTENPAHNPTFNAAVDKARKAKINLAISNPCFEYWYYIHFDPSSRPFANGQEMKRKLRTYIPKYNESMNVFPILESLTSTAMKHADKLRKRSPESWDVFPNPSTWIDKLVQEIFKMGQTKKY